VVALVLTSVAAAVGGTALWYQHRMRIDHVDTLLRAGARAALPVISPDRRSDADLPTMFSTAMEHRPGQGETVAFATIDGKVRYVSTAPDTTGTGTVSVEQIAGQKSLLDRIEALPDGEHGILQAETSAGSIRYLLIRVTAPAAGGSHRGSYVLASVPGAISTAPDVPDGWVQTLGTGLLLTVLASWLTTSYCRRTRQPAVATIGRDG
jgi:hypothetical protein